MPLSEPRVTLKVEGTPTDFLVNTGAQYSVLLQPQGKLADKTSWVQGATGMKQYQRTTRRSVDLGAGRVSHSFMVILECPFPPLGRDLLTKMGAQIHFLLEKTKIPDQTGNPIQVLTVQLEDEYRLHQKPILPQWTFKYGWMNSPMHGLRQREPALRAPPSYIYRSQARGRPCPGPTIPHDPGGPTGDQSPYLQTLGPEDLEALPVSLEYPPPPCQKKTILMTIGRYRIYEKSTTKF